MKKALYRKRICAEKEKLTPEKVFHTPQYRDLLTSIGHEITGGKLTTLRLYDDKNSGIAGWNQGETVAVNLGNQITSSFLTLELKSDSLIGILGHECGHYRYTDSALRKRYAEHMLNGSWYPKEPVPENAQEKEALDAMNVYFERKDKAILSIFLQTASYLSNLLNDMYIEEKMCALFPGSIRRGILMNRDRNVEWLPTLREMLETEKDRLSILMNLCAQYALSSRVNAWDGADYELIDTLKLLMPVIDEAGKAADDMERYLATNHILLMIWKYFAEIIDEIEKNSTENEEQKPEQEEREGQEENPNESEEEPEEEKQGNTGSQTEQNEDKIRKEDTEQESETEDKTERNGKDQETEDPENGRTAELQKFLQQLCENLPKCVRESGGFEDKQNECGIPASETEASSDNALQKILYEMAKETLDEKIQKEIFEHLQKELMEIPFEEGHDLVQKKLCRKTEISDFLKLLTEKYEGQLEQVKKRLRLKLLPILKNQKERTEHKLFLGRPTLAIRDITLRYKKRTILHQIALSVAKGEVIGVVGHNGAGKTTFSRALCGLHKDCEGEFLWNGQPLEHKLRMKRSYMVMQDVNYELFAESVEAECSFGIRNPDQDLVKTTMAELGLTTYRERHPNTLSGGQKQRVAVAVSMICGKDLLVFDEPTSGLDFDSMAQVAGLIKRLSEQGKIIFIVTHDFEFVCRTCSRVLHFDEGEMPDDIPVVMDFLPKIRELFSVSGGKEM